MTLSLFSKHHVSSNVDKLQHIQSTFDLKCHYRNPNSLPCCTYTQTYPYGQIATVYCLDKVIL